MGSKLSGHTTTIDYVNFALPEGVERPCVEGAPVHVAEQNDDHN